MTALLRKWLPDDFVRMVFAVLVAVQVLHLLEHVAQIVQLHLLGWPEGSARGVISTLDVEKVHFVWNLAVLGAVAWLLRKGEGTSWLVLTLSWAALHTAEHGYLLARALASGLEGQAGVLGARGLLATSGWSFPGLTTWSRATVHFAWNLGEVTLLGVAFAVRSRAGVWRWAALRARALVVPAVLLFIVALLAFSSAAPPDPVSALAPVEVWANGFLDLRGVVVEASGAVFVADRKAGTVTRIAPDHSRTIVASSLERPIGLALDATGRLLIAEEQAGRLVRVEADGTRTTLIAGIKQPRWVAAADDGALFVSARRLTRGSDPEPDDESAEPEAILTLSAAGQLFVFADRLRQVQGLVLHEGVVYAATQGRQETGHVDGVVLRIPILPDGHAGLVTPLGPSAAFKQPLAIARDQLGALFLTAKELRLVDRSKNVVVKLRPDGALGSFAARLDDPQGLAFDGTGNLYVADGNTGRVLRFRAPPAPLFASLPTFTNQSPLTVGGTTDPGARIDLFVNDAATSVGATANSTGAFSTTVPLDINDRNTIDGFATGHGGDGLTSAQAEAVTIHDGIAPAIVFQTPAAGAFVRQVVAVQAQGSDAASGLESLVLSVDAQALPSAIAPTPPAPALTATASWSTAGVADGTHTLTASALDRAGNRASASRIVVVDNTPPDTQITAGPSGETAETAATFGFTGSDNLTPTGSLVFAWRLDGGAFTPFSATTTASLGGLVEGAHTFEVKARDLAGNEDQTPATRSFTVGLGPSITGLAPASGAVGTFVTITGARFEAGATQVAFNGTPATPRSVTAKTITTTVPLAATTGPVTITTVKGAASRLFTITRTSDFTLTAVPSQATVVAGGSVSYSVKVDGASGFTGLVPLSVTGAPADLEVALSSPALGPGQTGTVTVRSSAGSTAGTRSFTISGSATIDGVAVGRSQTVALAIVASGVTALSGRVLDTDGLPVQGVTLTLAGRSISSDAAGNFLLLDVPAGADQFLFLDGSTAVPDRKYPSFPALVTIEAGRVNALPFTPFLHEQKTSAFTPIVPAQETVVADPAVPGFEMRIPSDVTIIGWDGQPNTKVSVRTVPLDRMPLPHPDPPIAARSVYMFYFDKVGGGVPSRPVPVTATNDLGLAPGEKTELWYYDEGPTPGSAANRWLMAGTGTVSADGTTITTDPGVGLPRFCCGAFCFASVVSGSTTAQSLTRDGVRGGEPVDLATGLFVLERADLVLPGRLPLVVNRTYRSGDTALGAFGAGTSAFFTDSVQRPTPQSLIYIETGNTRTTFARRADGTFTTTSVPGLRGAVFTSNPDGTLALRLRDGATRIFEPTFGTNFQLRAVVDRVGNTITIVRDGLGRPTSLVEPGSRKLSLTFGSGFTGILSVQDPLGRTVQYAYDGAFRLSTVTDPAGGVTRYTYDGSGNMTTITDPRGATVLTNQYSASGRVVKQTQADGGEWRFAYMVSGARVTGPDCPGPRCPEVESLDQIQAGYTFSGGYIVATTVTDPRGHTTTYRFNNFGHVIERLDALGQSTRFERAEGTNLLLSTTDQIGRVTRFTYDARGNVTSITDSVGNVRRLAYEPSFNELTSLTDPLGGVTTFTYDGQGNLTAVADPLGNRTTMAYNQFGQPLSATDPMGNTTAFTYDGVGNLTAISDPLGNATTRVYDAVSRLVSEADPRGKSTGFAYDALSRVTNVVDALGGNTRLTYDANGNVLTVTDAGGNATTHIYDAMDRLVSRTDGVGGGETFGYDFLGNPIRHTSRKGQLATFTYDALNRRTAAAYVDSTVSLVYDTVGRLAQTTDSLGGTILNQYDALDQLLSETTELGTLTYQYDTLGRRTSMTAPGQSPVVYGYDAASRLTSITQAAQLVQLQYDPAGRRTGLTLPNQVLTAYHYDQASRLTAMIYRNAAGPLGDLAYQYDSAGNRVAISGSFARTLFPEPISAATYDAANRQLAFGDKAMSYDANGNLAAITDPSGTTTLTWDARDRLVGLTTPSTSATWTYDASSRRTHSTIGGNALHHLYDRDDIVQTHTVEGVTSFLRTLVIDETLARDTSDYLLSDALGSTVALTDTAGVLTTRHVYEPFGRALSEGAESINPFQFTARENDTAIGLYSYRARTYSPTLHRFTSEDPLGWLAGPNPYSYALNNPLLFRDPHGLDVTVALYPGAAGFDHIGIGINTLQTVGHYPVTPSIAMLLGSDVPGIVHADRRRPIQIVTIPTSAVQDDAMQRVIAEALRRPRSYNLLSRNCAVFAEEVLRAGGLQVPSTNLPIRLMNQLQRRHLSREASVAVEAR